jgi:hypothetical protein
LTVVDGNGNEVLAAPNAALAIVFAPGAVLPGQDRTAGAASVCGGNNNAANYLDAYTTPGPPPVTNPPATTYINATGTAGTHKFISPSPPAPSSLFNDKLLPITRDALFPVVEMRVARELRLSLLNYYNTPDPPPSGPPRRYYPFAAPFPDTIATVGTYRGYVPTGATPACAPPTPDLSPLLPAWFVPNNWQHYMVYAVAPRCTARILTDYTVSILASDPPPPCSVGCIPFGGSQICTLSKAVDPATLNCNNTFDGAPPGSWLTISGPSGTSGIYSLVLPASYPISPQLNRPCSTVADCLELVGTSNENIDADNYVYVKPVRSATNNDNLVIVAPP